MSKNINVKTIIKNNPLIEEKSFVKERSLIISRKNMANKPKYNILPPFTTEKQIRTSVEDGEKTDNKH